MLSDALEDTLALFGNEPFDRPLLTDLRHWNQPMNRSTVAIQVLNNLTSQDTNVREIGPLFRRVFID